MSHEHRYHHQLQAYWERLRETRAFPDEQDIDPDAIDDIWPSCFLVSVRDAARGKAYRYTYLGKDLMDAYGEETYNPDVVARLMSTTTAPMVDKFKEVILTAQPVIDESEFVNRKQLNIKYRTCLLPLGDGAGGVGFVIGCMRWKLY